MVLGLAEGGYDYSTTGDALPASVIATLDQFIDDIGSGAVSVPNEPVGPVLLLDEDGNEIEGLEWEQGFDAIAPAGTVRLPELGGIQFELDIERQIIQQGPAFTAILHERAAAIIPAEVDLVAPFATSSDEPLTTIDQLIAALQTDIELEMTPIGEVVTSIGVARGFAHTGKEFEELDPEVAWLKVGDGGWGPYPFGQLWLLETERGLFMVTAEALEPGPLLDEAIVTAARVLETIEFADLATE